MIYGEYCPFADCNQPFNARSARYDALLYWKGRTMRRKKNKEFDERIGF